VIRLAIVALLALAGCGGPTPPTTPSASADTAMAVDCGGIAADTCAEVADAAALMLGTLPLSVEELQPPPDDDGTPMAERYLVRLVPDDAGDELVEVVRFSGSDNWSVRRAPPPSGDN